MKNLRCTLFTFLWAMFAIGAAAQTVNSVTINPTPAYSNTPLTAIVEGELGNPCYDIYGWSNVSGSVVTVYMTFAAQPVICIQVVVPYTYPVSIGTLSAGTYTLRVVDPNTGVLLYTTQFTVYNTGCQPPSANQLFASNISYYSARLNSPAISGANYYQFRYRQPGYAWTAPSYSTLNYRDISNLLPNTTYEFQCRVYCSGAWTSYSGSQYFVTTPSGNNCNNPVTLSCGNTYFGSNNIGGYQYTNYYLNGGLLFSNMTGPEVYHRFTLTATSNVIFSLTGLTADLDLMLMSSCNNTSMIWYSGNFGNTSEQISMQSLAPGTYTIIVDGWQGAVSNYNLSVQCTQIAQCNAPTFNEVYTTNLTATSVRLNCSTPGIYYDWSYRPIGASSWVDLPSGTQNYYDLTGLQPNTAYEFLAAVRCSNGLWSTWSPNCTFTTLNIVGNNCYNPIIASCGNTYYGNNGTGGYNFNQYYYNGQYIAEIGPEVIYSITLPYGGPLTINLNGLSADLDLFVVSNCNPNTVLAASGNSGSSSEHISIPSLVAGTYQIIVEGWNGYTSNYALTVNCNGGNANNDEPCSATTLFANSSCVQHYSTNTNATTTYNPAPPSECNTSGMKDVWFAVQIPATGKMAVQTFPGTMTDGVIGVYAGSCSNLSYYGCVDDTNGDYMPDISVSGVPGTWVYLRFWGYGGSSGTFSLCVVTTSNFAGDEDADIVIGDTGSDEREAVAEEGAIVEEVIETTQKLNIYPVPARDYVNFSTRLNEDASVAIQIFDLNGKMVGELTGLNGTSGEFSERMEVIDFPAGLYLVKMRVGEHELSGKFSKM